MNPAPSRNDPAGAVYLDLRQSCRRRSAPPSPRSLLTEPLTSSRSPRCWPTTQTLPSPVGLHGVASKVWTKRSGRARDLGRRPNRQSARVGSGPQRCSADARTPSRSGERRRSRWLDRRRGVLSRAGTSSFWEACLPQIRSCSAQHLIFLFKEFDTPTHVTILNNLDRCHSAGACKNDVVSRSPKPSLNAVIGVNSDQTKDVVPRSTHRHQCACSADDGRL